MLDHLLDFDPPTAFPEAVVTLSEATPQQVLDAQLKTAEWLEAMGAPAPGEAELVGAQVAARNAFSVVASAKPDEQQKQALVALKTPTAVRHLVGMLTSYDWEFVQQAKELRGYAVAQILEETKHTDARIRLRALELLGRVTEVALFTDRLHVEKKELRDDELDQKIKEKLNKFMRVTDATPVVDAVSHAAT